MKELLRTACPTGAEGREILRVRGYREPYGVAASYFDSITTSPSSIRTLAMDLGSFSSRLSKTQALLEGGEEG
jgi:hypothetical protein